MMLMHTIDNAASAQCFYFYNLKNIFLLLSCITYSHWNKKTSTYFQMKTQTDKLEEETKRRNVEKHAHCVSILCVTRRYKFTNLIIWEHIEAVRE